MFILSRHANLTWPVHEGAVTQSGDLHPPQEEHSGRDVGLHDVRPRLRRKRPVLWVKTETLTCRDHKDLY